MPTGLADELIMLSAIFYGRALTISANCAGR
jgi:hypothetical protein